MRVRQEERGKQEEDGFKGGGEEEGKEMKGWRDTRPKGEKRREDRFVQKEEKEGEEERKVRGRGEDER